VTWKSWHMKYSTESCAYSSCRKLITCDQPKRGEVANSTTEPEEEEGEEGEDGEAEEGEEEDERDEDDGEGDGEGEGEGEDEGGAGDEAACWAC